MIWRLGELVLAIGSPNGIEYINSVTIGVVSGLDRMVNVFDSDGDGVKDYSTKMVQHDASINHGNSGGPLFNIEGEIVGVNTLKIIYQDSENMGFAVAPDYTKRVLFALIEDGEFKTVKLGIYGSIYAVEVDHPDFAGGVVIKEVIENGAVYNSKADVEVDDIIIGLNGHVIYNLTDIRDALFVISPGDTVEMKLFRNGEIVTTNVTFD